MQVKNKKQKSQPKRRSVRLTSDEKSALRAFVKQQPTIVEAAENIGIHRNVLDRVLLVWSGAPETITLIRKAIAA